MWRDSLFDRYRYGGGPGHSCDDTKEGQAQPHRFAPGSGLSSGRTHLLERLVRTALISAAIAIFVSGCASYIPPGPKADLQAFAPPDIQAGFATKATNPFPAGIAVVRVQAPAYTNYHLQQRGGIYGTGRYSVVLAKEAEED